MTSDRNRAFRAQASSTLWLMEHDGRFDLAVVGAGIVGLAHAWHARRAGMRVVVLERDSRAVGASVRNFGHVCTTAQSGHVLDLARAAAEDWRTITADAGIPTHRDGTVVIARTAAEAGLLEEFHEARGDEVRPLTATETSDRLGFAPSGLMAGAWLPGDLRVNAPTAVPAIAAHLARLGVEFRWRTTAHELEPGAVRTSRGPIAADRIVAAAGHDVDRFFPEAADAHVVLRCRLRMLELDGRGIRMAPALLTGTSMLRYGGMSELPAARSVRAEIEATEPALLAQDVNLMATQRPDGNIVLGDTHHIELTESPFEDETADELLLAQAEALFGARPIVRRRWRGVYASSPIGPFFVATPTPGVTAVTVTSGIGMTTAFGLAREVLGRTPVPG